MFRLFACLVSLAVVAEGLAQAPPRPLGRDIISATSDLSPQQREQVRNWADYWCSRLDSDDPAAVENARAEVLRPLTGLMPASDRFRWEYSKAAVPRLTKALASPYPHVAVNAMIVLPLMGSDRALALVLEHCDEQNEPRGFVRQRAAAGAKAMLYRNGKGAISLRPAAVKKAVRELRDAARNEPNCLILRHQFEAMAEVDDPTTREHLVDALKAVVERIADKNSAPSTLIEAVYSAVARLREGFLNLPLDEQQELGRKLAPVLDRVCEVARIHWEMAQNDPAAKEIYGGAIRVCEEFLKIIHLAMRADRSAPRTQLKRHWDDRDKPRFERDKLRWSEIIATYRNP
ncbi:MAG: hypothetical protein ACYSTY_04975 [Planctomycetota bacterium]